MLNTVVLATLAGLASASPAANAPINFAAILSATGPSLSGPPAAATGQTGVYNAAAASSSAAAAVTGVASASATQSVAARDLEKRTFCIFGWCIGGGGGGSSSSGWGYGGSSGYGESGSDWDDTTSTPKAVASTNCATSTPKAVTVTPTKSVPAITSTAVTIVTTAPAITSAPASTCTPISWTNTNAFTTASACAAPFEVGTYCGFINPEDPCAVQPDGHGAQVQPDTVEAFEAYQPFHQMAQNAQAPAGYAATFQDLNAAVTANTYLGLYTLKSYDVAQCASLCDKTALCTGINLYVERDPSINPEGCSCNNPASMSNFKCTLWGSGVDKAAATNTGQGRSGFQVVVTASNGYEKTNNTQPEKPSGWTNPQSCGGNVHNHPNTCIGQQFFPGPFDVGVCASYAASQNSKNSLSIGLSSWASWFGYSPLKCNFFNAFMVKENGVAKGTYCSLFSQQYTPSAASYQPGVSAGISWSVESSWSFCSA